jgi:hypothetical protein
MVGNVSLVEWNILIETLNFIAPLYITFRFLQKLFLTPSVTTLHLTVPKVICFRHSYGVKALWPFESSYFLTFLLSPKSCLRHNSRTDVSIWLGFSLIVQVYALDVQEVFCLWSWPSIASMGAPECPF